MVAVPQLACGVSRKSLDVMMPPETYIYLFLLKFKKIKK